MANCDANTSLAHKWEAWMGTKKTYDQIVRISSAPSSRDVRDYFNDLARVKEPEPTLWVGIHGEEVHLNVHVLDVSKVFGKIWTLTGTIRTFTSQPRVEGIDFSLTVWMDESGTKRPTTFSFKNVPVKADMACECCEDGPICKITDNGYWCPACHHTRPFIRLWDKRQGHGAYPAHCMDCGVKMEWAGNIVHCTKCGKTSQPPL